MKTRTPLSMAVVALTMAGCATPNPPAAPGVTPPAATATPGAAPPPASAASGAATAAAGAPAAALRAAPLPGALTAFAEVTREAKRADGFLPTWTRDDRTWLEIPADRLDKPFFFGSSIAGGLGDSSFWPGLTGRSNVVVLRRVGNNIQLLALNQAVRAPEGTPLARAVSESWSDSLLAVAPLVAAPHATSKALVDANALLGVDFSGWQTTLEVAHRLPYALDRANSSIERVRNTAEGTYVTMRQHYSVPRLPAPPAPGGPPPNPAAQPNPPATLPDARSLFVTMAYTFTPLPAQPMQTRRADARVGYFTRTYTDFGNDRSENQRTHIVNRWRLEKKDPSADVSEPKVPIRVVLDRNIPEKWREPLRTGALEWNKAFERAGFRNAIVVEQQAADADWSSVEGNNVLAVRWFTIAGPGATAVGPSQADPRTGEILRGAAIIPENWVRVGRARNADTEPRVGPKAFATPYALPIAELCTLAHDGLEHAQMNFDLLVARGRLDPDSPEADDFIRRDLIWVTMHEVGHALGLRHNFRASVGITPAQLRDPAFTARRGLTNSVMDYVAPNTPLDNETIADYSMTTLGAYDYWAIEYGYRPFASPEEEKRELARLAAMAEVNPDLAYATDEDAIVGIDPLVNLFDLGNDPLAYAQRRVKLVRELWQRISARQLAPDDDMTLYRRTVQRVVGVLGDVAPNAAKYIGGTITRRARAGSGLPLVEPVPAAQQRAALDFILAELFDSASFKFDPRILSRMGTDQVERFNVLVNSGRTSGIDYSLPNAVLAAQRPVLDTLMSDGLASRLADAEAKVTDPKTLNSFADVQQRLGDAVWSELGAKGARSIEIDSLRRNLQREHVRRLAAALLRPASTAAADVRPVMRQAALQLQARLQAALNGGAGKASSALVRAHLDDSLATLTEALKAPLVKQGA
jgi:hypothetical protein